MSFETDILKKVPSTFYLILFSLNQCKRWFKSKDFKKIIEIWITWHENLQFCKQSGVLTPSTTTINENRNRNVTFPRKKRRQLLFNFSPTKLSFKYWIESRVSLTTTTTTTTQQQHMVELQWGQLTNIRSRKKETKRNEREILSTNKFFFRFRMRESPRGVWSGQKKPKNIFSFVFLFEQPL